MASTVTTVCIVSSVVVPEPITALSESDGADVVDTNAASGDPLVVVEACSPVDPGVVGKSDGDSDGTPETPSAVVIADVVELSVRSTPGRWHFGDLGLNLHHDGNPFSFSEGVKLDVVSSTLQPQHCVLDAHTRFTSSLQKLAQLQLFWGFSLGSGKPESLLLSTTTLLLPLSTPPVNGCIAEVPGTNREIAVVTVGEDAGLVPSTGGFCEIFEVETGGLPAEVPGTNSEIAVVTVGEDARLVLSTGGSCEIFEVETG